MSWEGPFRHALVLGALLAAGGPATASAKACPGAELRLDGGNRAAVAAATLCLVNAERAEAGLRRLEADRKLRRAATGHSRDMVARRYFAHESPAGSTIEGRVRKAGYLRGAKRYAVRENLGWGRGAAGTPAGLVAAWMRSPVHRPVVLSRVMREAGIGLAQGTPSGGRGATYTMLVGMRRQ